MSARRQAVADACRDHREHTTRQRKAAEQSAEQWRQAIRDALTELDHDDTTSETGAAR